MERAPAVAAVCVGTGGTLVEQRQALVGVLPRPVLFSTQIQYRRSASFRAEVAETHRLSVAQFEMKINDLSCIIHKFHHHCFVVK